MAKPSEALKQRARKYGVRLTRTVGGRRIPKTAIRLRTDVSNAIKSRKILGSSNKSEDLKYKAKKAGKRKAKAYSYIKVKVRDPKTGNLVVKMVKRKNATAKKKGGKKIYPKTGNVYYERRRDRADKGKFL